MNQAIRTIVLLSIVLVGVGAPLLKVSQKLGINASQILYINSLSCLIIGTAGYYIFDYSNTQPTLGGIGIAFLATMILNVSFISVNRAFSLDGGYVSLIYSLAGASSLITVLIGLIFLNESEKVVVSRLLLGAGLILSGSFLVSSSVK